MATVLDILGRKGNQVFNVRPNATVLDAAVLMNEHKIGGLVVTEEDRVAGIVTERDVLRKVVAARRDPAEVPVSQIMTDKVVCVSSDTSLDEARAIFMERRIRHLPVVDAEGRVEGMISIGDVNAWRLDGQATTIHYLHEYLYGHVS